MYIDPGFGSMIIQVIIASLAVLSAIFGIYRAKIVSFFKKGNKNSDEKSDE